LRIQTQDAAAWRDKCLRYFQAFSRGAYSGEPGHGPGKVDAREGVAR
jgi:hypothetical protein